MIFVALFMITEIAFFTVAHMLPDDYIGDQPRVQEPADTAAPPATAPASSED